MASASSFPCEEQLQCSICLDVFTEPVSTPCGHNYCKTCIMGYWASSGPAQCPLCKKKFRKRPQLRVNTEFRDMVKHFNNMRVRGEDDILAKQGEVPCDICLGSKLKAQKTCLVCLASYCQPHLEPHQRVKTLKKHQLIDPVSNLEDRVCKKHDKMFELFCYKDQMCVCFMCLKDNHATHEVVPLEKAFRERKAQLEYVTSEIEIIENNKSRLIREIKQTVEKSKKESEKEIADIAEIFKALVVSLQRSQAELIKVIQENQKAALKQAEDRMTQLEQDIAESRRIRSETEQLIQTDDHLGILQNWPYRPVIYLTAHNEDLLSPPFTKDVSDISPQSYVGMAKKAVAHMEKTLSNDMEMLIHEVRLSDGCEASEVSHAAEELMRDEFVKEVWTPPQDKLTMIQQYDAVDVTLDAYTANSKLTVSEDGTQVRFIRGPAPPPSLFVRRFVHQPFILGKEGFSSGRFYYEVGVRRCKSWVLGVVKYINVETFFYHYDGEACSPRGNYNLTYTYSSPAWYLGQRHQRVGVFVDYEKGEVSFYDVDARTLIHSYTGCDFIEPPAALKSFLYSLAGTYPSNRPKLYPIFGMLDEDYDSMLEITPVARTT